MFEMKGADSEKVLHAQNMCPVEVTSHLVRGEAHSFHAKKRERRKYTLNNSDSLD